MRTRFCTAMLLAAAAMAAAWGVIPVAGQTAAYRAPRTADGKPNVNGIWQSLNEANWDVEGHSAGPGRVVALGAEDAVVPGLGIVEGGPLPYLPAALAKKKANFDKRLTLDPEIKCYLPGVPRAMYLPQPFQIVQSTKVIMMAFQYAGAVRTIYMDDHKEAPADSYKAVEDAYRSSKKKLGQEYFVVDCDRHIIEPPEAFTMFLDKEFLTILGAGGNASEHRERATGAEGAKRRARGDLPGHL